MLEPDNIKENAATVELKCLKMPLSAMVVEYAGEAPPVELDNKSMTKGKATLRTGFVFSVVLLI